MRLNKQKILSLLADKQMTRSNLAKASGIRPQNLSTILKRGSCEPITAGKIARGLGVPVEAILKGE